MTPKDHLPKYKELTLIERFWLRTCFRFVGKGQPVGVTSQPKNWEQRLKESDYFLRKSFGADIISDFNSKHVLDFGCGEGHFALAIALAAPKAEVVGVDIQERFVGAQAQAKQRGVSRLTFVLGHSQSLADNSFDFILSHDSFEHFDDPKVILKEMTRLLKPDGRILIKFGPTWMGPYGRHMFNVFRKDRPWMHLIIPEKSVMRIYSVIKRLPVLHESYRDYPDGLNKMTVAKAQKLLQNNGNTTLLSFEATNYLEGTSLLKKILRPLLAVSICAELLSKEVIAVLGKLKVENNRSLRSH
jgi:2-polyprenyl-3-methyl-5-hydroxy-6-metoxy-1,4-benzoquinol methylase